MKHTRTWVVAALCVLLAGAASAWALGAFGRGNAAPERLRIATGVEGGTYLPLGESVAEILERTLPDVDVSVLTTEGSVENVRLLESGAAELAFLQDDTLAGSDVRTIAPLYLEVLHLVVRLGPDEALQGIPALAGRLIAIGAPGSGTARVARPLLAHFGIDDRTADLVELDAASARQAFTEGTLDAVFVMGGLPSPLVGALLDLPDARLMGLGDPTEIGSAVEGVTRAMPRLKGALIPAATYGTTPVEPVGAVATWAVFVARRDVPDLLIRRATGALFAERALLRARHPILSRLSEESAAGPLLYPLHAGARDHYERNEPSFFVEYAEPISLGFTLLVALGSALLALREWVKRRKKNRIDVYYEAIAEISSEAEGADDRALHDLRRRLLELRRNAFSELVAERLAADQSFTIFQDYVQSEIELLNVRLPETRS